MSTSSKQLSITVDQYERFKGYPGLKDELIYGAIVLSPQPKPYHQQLAENLQRLLSVAAEPYGYVAKQNSNIKFELAHSIPAPDVLIVTAAAWKAASLYFVGTHCRRRSAVSFQSKEAAGGEGPTVSRKQRGTSHSSRCSSKACEMLRESCCTRHVP